MNLFKILILVKSVVYQMCSSSFFFPLCYLLIFEIQRAKNYGCVGGKYTVPHKSFNEESQAGCILHSLLTKNEFSIKAHWDKISIDDDIVMFL